MVQQRSLAATQRATFSGFDSGDTRTAASYERELGERRKTEADLRGALALAEAALHRREILSMESDHRLLNGLQMVVSLLAMQSRSEPHAEAATQLKTAANRVATIAGIHRRLHSLDGEKTVAIRAFLDELCREYGSMLALDERGQSIVVEGCEAWLPAATAIPLSLIVNELITNAAKYGHGVITVRLEETAGDGGYVLSVCNSGPALPADFNPANSSGLGMKIVTTLIAQIGGRLLIERCEQRGTRFAVAFAPVPLAQQPAE